jgi:hypothetical protein
LQIHKEDLVVRLVPDDAALSAPGAWYGLIFVTSSGRLKICIFVTLENLSDHSSLQMFWMKTHHLDCGTCEGSPLLITQIPSPQNDEYIAVGWYKCAARSPPLALEAGMLH